jgi:hypothetical protein
VIEPKDPHPFNTPWSIDPDTALDIAMGDFVPPPPPPATPKRKKKEKPPHPSADAVTNAQGIVGGIDAGKSGFTALVFPDGSVEAEEAPVIEEVGYDLRAMLDRMIGWRERGVRHVVLEEQSPHAPERLVKAEMIHTFIRAAFQIGRGSGLWEMALTAAGISHELAKPSTWKARMGITVPRGSASNGDERRKIGKRLAIQQCQRLCPTVDLRRNPRCRTPDDGKAEAILLAIYGVRRLAGAY